MNIADWNGINISSVIIPIDIVEIGNTFVSPGQLNVNIQNTGGVLVDTTSGILPVSGTFTPSGI